MDDMRDEGFEIGDQVIFLGHNEWQVRWGDCDETVGVLEPGATYQIREIEVHSWHTKIRLVGFNGKGFNDCMFKLAEPEKQGGQDA